MHVHKEENPLFVIVGFFSKATTSKDSKNFRKTIGFFFGRLILKHHRKSFVF
ncbi:hypothetical protein LEP1GSC045_4362 [Leptospira interrogans serovar Pomona str. Kennewicki LC82-25]|uniref:Uncharacterized protein n=1 Tax=Leptospira interrogans str. UI 12758 TaxID=1049938 RepID=A0A0E2D036_LEPIR|nr:hypothetical protein LEP1GSC045_4362 [Leptospira interrogans serovar Pomona str. Kennewicki LC82-25]EKN96760.1 hypothetical protein LEP1GSC014_1238 [Leptospira interrogans serovar Pomona str. Pomona]EKO71573.1 hypothetical protein LEP1GSC069_3424 [Leptospira interrogans serovar Canicola str. Fiocruz LV133]EKR53399.1 hypothetical protein LEP1GSC105_4766 [Leptospira interrogans str. UI 12758]EMF35039.1 hypothetical protein LEP1GSC201_3704 [Leptospira interrogans serovar Pomona str. Fox 32256]